MSRRPGASEHVRPSSELDRTMRLTASGGTEASETMAPSAPVRRTAAANWSRSPSQSQPPRDPRSSGPTKPIGARPSSGRRWAAWTSAIASGSVPTMITRRPVRAPTTRRTPMRPATTSDGTTSAMTATQPLDRSSNWTAGGRAQQDGHADERGLEDASAFPAGARGGGPRRGQRHAPHGKRQRSQRHVAGRQRTGRPDHEGGEETEGDGGGVGQEEVSPQWRPPGPRPARPPQRRPAPPPSPAVVLPAAPHPPAVALSAAPHPPSTISIEFTNSFVVFPSPTEGFQLFTIPDARSIAARPGRMVVPVFTA